MHGAFYLQIISSLGVLVGIICLAMALRRIGMFSSDHGGILAKLVLNVSLPALIFRSLSRAHISPRLFDLVGIMLGAQIVCLFLAYAIGSLTKLPRGRTGALLLTSAFGSSGLLGYALIAQAFPGNEEAMTEAAMISEMAVAPLIFTLGVAVAIHFGGKKRGFEEGAKRLSAFFISPVFIALIAGLLWSFAGMPTPAGALKILFDGLDVLASANTFLAAMTVGLLLRFKNVRPLLGLAAVVCLIKLAIQPVLTWLPMQMISVSPLHQRVLVLEAAMPAMALSVVFAKSYDCDAEAASVMLFATYIVSTVTLVAVPAILFG